MTVDPACLDFSDEVARAAFLALLREARPLSASALAGAIDADERRVLDTFSAVAAVGRAEFDGDGQLAGVYGLTLRRTEHRLELRGKKFFVWCAFDAVGIPAALGESALVQSECAGCGRELRFEIAEGRPPDLPIVISWLPRECGSVREEFCPTVNFYCDPSHYESADPGGVAAGAYLTLQAAAELGRESWGWAAE